MKLPSPALIVTLCALFAAVTLSACGSTSESTPSNQADQFSALPLRGPSGSDGTYNCGDFDTQNQAQTYFEAAGDIDGLDGDGNGLACESLPSEDAAPPAVPEIIPTQEAATDSGPVGEDFSFQSPTGNLICSGSDMSDVPLTLLTCFVRNLGVIVVFVPGGAAVVNKVEGVPPAFRGQITTLDYGEAVTLSRVFCESSDVGIQCYSVDDAQDGFRISREGVFLFPATSLDAMSDADAYAGAYEFS